MENIDASQIKPADDSRDRKRIQACIWEHNETLAAAHSRNYQQYLSRFSRQMRAHPIIVRGLVHQGRSTLVLVSTHDGLEVRRVQNDIQEAIAHGKEVAKVFPRSSR